MDTTNVAKLPLRAFNLMPGAVFMPPSQIEVSNPKHLGQWLVAVEVERPADHAVFDEKVLVKYRTMVGTEVNDEDYRGTTQLDYNDVVELIGLVVNPDDLDDTDAGNEGVDFYQEYIKLDKKRSAGV